MSGRKFRFATNGDITVAEIDGKTIGPGVEKIAFEHTGGENAKLTMEIDLCDFHFLQDGEYEKREIEIINSR